MKRVLMLALLFIGCTAPIARPGDTCEVSECSYEGESALYCMGGTLKAFECGGGCNYADNAIGITCDPRGAEPGDRCPPPLGRSMTCSGRREVIECRAGIWQVVEACDVACSVDVDGVNAKCIK